MSSLREQRGAGTGVVLPSPVLWMGHTDITGTGTQRTASLNVSRDASLPARFVSKGGLAKGIQRCHLQLGR